MINPIENPDAKMGQPIDSWTKEQFVAHGKMLLEAIRKMAPDVRGNDHARGIFASNWTADHIRSLYEYMENGKFLLTDIGTNEEELKEAIAPSGLPNNLTEGERAEIWQRVFKKSS